MKIKKKEAALFVSSRLGKALRMKKLANKSRCVITGIKVKENNPQQFN